jgi:hypothetical protein
MLCRYAVLQQVVLTLLRFNGDVRFRPGSALRFNKEFRFRHGSAYPVSHFRAPSLAAVAVHSLFIRDFGNQWLPAIFSRYIVPISEIPVPGFENWGYQIAMATAVFTEVITHPYQFPVIMNQIIPVSLPG